MAKNKRIAIKKFFESRFGFALMFFVVLPLLTLSASSGVNYYRIQTESKNKDNTLVPTIPIETTSDIENKKTTPQSTASNNNEPNNTESNTQGRSAQQIYQDAVDKQDLYEITCTNPASSATSTFLQTQQNAVDQAWTDKNAIPYSPGTVEYRTAYNRVAFYRNSNIELAYSAYTRSIENLNDTMQCGMTPVYQKWQYWELMNADGQYIVPYVEGSSLSSYL